MASIAATESNPGKEAYYKSTLEIGQCHKEKLSNRTGGLILEMGVNLQDLKVNIGIKNNLRIIRNERQWLTYIEENIWYEYIHKITTYNKEIKLRGQSKINFDPRRLPNDMEIGDEVGKDYEDEIEEEEKIKAKENRQRENQEQFQKDKLDTYQKRNETEQKNVTRVKNV